MPEPIELRDASGRQFHDISEEHWREYTFPKGDKVRIERPLRLHVSDNGHRILDAEGFSHYVPRTFIHLRWKVKDDGPHFKL